MSNDLGRSICTDSSGNAYIVGQFESNAIYFDTIPLINADNTGNTGDVYIAKYNASGKVIWAKNFGNNGYDIATDVAIDPSGNIVMTGFFSGTSITFGSYVLNNKGQEDIFVAKLDSIGNVTWALGFGGKYSESGMAVGLDNTGNVFVAGQTNSDTISLGANTFTPVNIDAYLAKIDAGGNVLWSKTCAGTGEEFANGLSVDKAGNVIIAGNFNGSNMGFDTDTIVSAGDVDVFVAKYDGAGNVLWAKSAGGIDSDFCETVTNDLSGNTIIAGTSYGNSMSFGNLTIAGNNGMYITKYDMSGNEQWVQAPFSNHTEYAYGITTDTAGNIFTTGRFGGSLLDFGGVSVAKPNPVALSSMYLVKHNPNGNPLWAIASCGDRTIDSKAVCITASGHPLVTGFYNSASVSFGSITLNNFTSVLNTCDIFVAKVDDVTGIEDNKDDDSNYVIYPNPGTGYFTAKCSSHIISIEITDQFGQLLSTQKVNSMFFSFEITTPGVYAVTLISQGGRVTKKVVVSR